MNRLVKGVALFVAIVSVVWIAVLWHWQATARDMSTGDIVAYLFILPVTVFAIALLGRWAWVGASERAARQAEARAAAPATAAAPAPGADEAERHATVQVLAVHVATAAGSSPGDLVTAARDGSPRPGLDPELRDDDGLPLLAARMADGDGRALEAESEVLVAALHAARPEWADRVAADTVWRALAILREPLLRSVDALAPWAPLLVPDPPPKADGASERCVRVLLGWPAMWTEYEQELGRTVAADWLAQRGANALPGARITISAQAVGGEELLLQADRLMQTLARAGHEEPVIVAACHSTIGSAAVAELEGQGLLYHPQRRAKGRMPAEAAAALVVAGPKWPAAEDADGPLPHLHRPALLRRDKSIDAPGRVGAQTAVAAMQSALAAGRVEAAAVAGLVGDADQHTERAAEFFQAAAETLPELDAGEDLCAIGHVTGSVGGVGALLVVACAVERARSDEKPCLALTVGDPHARLSLLALPGPPVPAVAPAPPA